MQSSRQLFLRRPLPFVVTLAIALRLAALLALPEVFAFERTGIIQGIGTHDVYAQNLLQTGVYGFEPGEPDGVLPPLYSLFLAAVYAVAGRGALQFVLVQALLDAASIALLHRIARRLWPGEPRVALIGALLYALYPYLLFQSLTMIDTSLYISGMYLLLWLLLQLNDASVADRRRLALLLTAGGATLCLLTLLRPNIVVLLPFAGLWLALRHGWRGSATRLLPVILLGGALLLPWMARSAGIYGQPVFIALHGGRNFWQGNNPCTLPYLRAGYDTQWQRETYAEEVALTSLVQRDSLAMQVALNWLRENPARIPELLWTKFITHWSVDIQPSRNPPVSAEGEAVAEDCEAGIIAITTIGADDPTRVYDESAAALLFRLVHRYWFGSLLTLALAGLVITRRRWRELSLLWLTLLSMTLVYVVYHPGTRYRAPTDPLLFLFSASALLEIRRSWLARRRSDASR